MKLDTFDLGHLGGDSKTQTSLSAALLLIVFWQLYQMGRENTNRRCSASLLLFGLAWLVPVGSAALGKPLDFRMGDFPVVFIWVAVCLFFGLVLGIAGIVGYLRDPCRYDRGPGQGALGVILNVTALVVATFAVLYGMDKWRAEQQDKILAGGKGGSSKGEAGKEGPDLQDLIFLSQRFKMSKPQEPWKKNSEDEAKAMGDNVAAMFSTKDGSSLVIKAIPGGGNGRMELGAVTQKFAFAMRAAAMHSFSRLAQKLEEFQHKDGTTGRFGHITALIGEEIKEVYVATDGENAYEFEFTGKEGQAAFLLEQAALLLPTVVLLDGDASVEAGIAAIVSQLDREGQCYFDEGDYQSAQRVWNEEWMLGGGTTSLLAQLVKVHLALKDPTRALAFVEAQKDRFPRNQEVAGWQAYLYGVNGNAKVALARYEEAFEAGLTTESFLLDYVNLLSGKGEESVNRALRVVSKFAERNNSPRVRRWQACLLSEAGRNAEALTLLQKLVLQPGVEPATLYKLGELANLVNQPQRAEDAVRRLLEMKQDGARTRCIEGWMKLAKGDAQAAAASFQLAAKYDTAGTSDAARGLAAARRGPGKAGDKRASPVVRRQ